MRFRYVGLMFLSIAFVGTGSFAQQVSARMPISAGVPLGGATNSNYGRLPLTFEANLGQISPEAKFRAHGKGYSAYLSAGEMVLTLRPTKVSTKKTTDSPLSKSPKQVSGVTLRFRLLGANPTPEIAGEDRQLGTVNYFIGSDPAKWQRNVPTYARVRCRSVYPGIDLVYYGSHQQLEYDFVVSPGANPRLIQFEIEGASEIALDETGNLVLQTGGGELHFQSPVIYQESNGRRVPVRGAYVMTDPTHVAFQVVQYDANKPLVIDPVLVYSTYLGGSGDDQPGGIAVDAEGNIYVAGSTDSTDFPLATLGSLPGGNTHVFIAKLDPTGSNLIYADYLGGNGQDYGYALALDGANNVYVTGNTGSSDFPMVNPFQGTYPGSSNAFLTKISPDGSSLLYSTYFGGNGTDVPSNVAVDSTGEMIVAGYTSSTNLPTASAFQSTVSANPGGLYGNYGFITKFNPEGSSLIYSTYFGGSSNLPLNCGGTPCWLPPFGIIAEMTIDASGNIYIAGSTNTYNFPVTEGAYQTTDSTQQGADTVGFVSKFNGFGSLQYSTYLYDPSGVETQITALAADGSGSAYVTGDTFGAGTFPVTATSICDPSIYGFACNNAFLTKFDAAGATLLYSTYLGPNNDELPQAIVLDANSDAYILGYTGSGSFSSVNGIESYSNENDLLLVEVDPTATTQLFATYLGGSGNDQPAPAGMVLDANGNLYVAGMTDSTDFPVMQPAFQSLLAGSTNGFIVKIGPASAPAVALSPDSLQYASQTIGSSSQPQTVLLRNMGSASLSISSITTSGDFAETDNCGNSVPAAGSCTFSATFTPTTSGTRNGTIVIGDDAAGSPHVISLSGSGLGAVVTVTPSALVFASTPVGTSAVAQTITLTNSGNATLSIGSIQVAGDYAQTNNCPASLSEASTCSINATFTPTTTGTRIGKVTIGDNAAGTPQTIALTGSGSDFALTSVPNSDTVKAGATASYTLTLSPLGGAFNSAVHLSCGGSPALTTCSLSPNTVTPGGSPVSVTLTISTTASQAEVVPLAGPSQERTIPAIWMQQGLGLLGIILLVSPTRSRKLRRIISMVLMTAAFCLMSACAGGTGITTPPQPGTAPGTYTITVTGASGALMHSLPETLIVK